jgi:hypothetical protein
LDSAINATQAAEATNHFNLSSTVIDNSNSYPRRPFQSHLDNLDNFIVFSRSQAARLFLASL